MPLNDLGEQVSARLLYGGWRSSDPPLQPSPDNAASPCVFCTPRCADGDAVKRIAGGEGEGNSKEEQDSAFDHYLRN
ncbi:hypothetical protein EYF80_054217 [Liparis tanakae]|uniref:Uncharacterized protein n=1 Tax=Liparis tanakae TaxID=230148 RepID=A0A4Z2F4J6_9TELE|nr:hypothetical protein EYF80_054217 [Liparis tanakae]